MLAQSSPDVVVLDVLMPDVDGLEVCRRMRAAGDRTPVLMLTARETVADRVAGLDAGADDYVVKPFDLDELLARVRALLRRSSNGDAPLLQFGDVALDRGAREATRGGRRIELTLTEYNLLELFMRHPRQVLSRSQIYERVWDYDFGPLSNSLSVYIGYLRRKLEAERRAARDPDSARHGLRAARAGPMTLRTRLALAAGLAVALAVAAAAVRRLLRRAQRAARRDRQLAARARLRSPRTCCGSHRGSRRDCGRRRRGAARASGRATPLADALPLPPDVQAPAFGGAAGVIQLVRADGTLSGPDRGESAIPVDERMQKVATRRRAAPT